MPWTPQLLQRALAIQAIIGQTVDPGLVGRIPGKDLPHRSKGRYGARIVNYDAIKASRTLERQNRRHGSARVDKQVAKSKRQARSSRR